MSDEGIFACIVTHVGPDALVRAGERKLASSSKASLCRRVRAAPAQAARARPISDSGRRSGKRVYFGRFFLLTLLGKLAQRQPLVMGQQQTERYDCDKRHHP
jgi:hypothetical protein